MFIRLVDMSPAELDGYLRAPAFATLFRGLRKSLQMQVLDLLCRERVASLSVDARSALIRSMMRGPTRKHHELAIRDLFMATAGADLTRLKRAVDRTRDHRDLLHLLYSDLEMDWIRDQILEHFQSQARLAPCPEVRVVSDVDDTVYCNWADPRYPAKAVYPGVFQLYKELDNHGEGAEIGDIVFLTGRADEPTGNFKKFYKRRFEKLGAENFSVMTGTVFHQFYRPWILKRKWFNLERHRLLYPEMGIVMFGDTGQADPEFLSRAVERYPGEIRAGLLHSVRPLPEPRRALIDRHGLQLFHTYVGAAVHLFQKGLIGPPALVRVMESARAQMAAIVFPERAQRAARERELEADLELARDALAA